MDDNSFDDLIKSKLESYEDNTIDQGAFESFSERLRASQPVPWYQQNGSRLAMAASAIIVTLINFYILTLYQSRDKIDVRHESKTSIQVVDSLSTIIKSLTEYNNVLGKEQRENRAMLSTYQVVNKKLEHMLTAKEEQIAKWNTTNPTEAASSSLVKLTETSEVPPSILKMLVDQDLTWNENDQLSLSTSYRLLRRALRQGQRDLYEPNAIELFSVNGVKGPNFYDLKLVEPLTVITGKKHFMSLKQRNELEKHYFSGIGINLGGHLDLAQSVFSDGNGSLNPRVGVVADWVVSPRLSVETGLDYLANSVKFDQDFKNIFLPLLTDQFGPLQTAIIENKLLSSPISIKYRQWVGEKTQGIAKVGYTPYYSFSNTYQYNYPLNKPRNPDDPDDPSKPHINTLEQSSYKGYYGGSVTASIGLSRLIKKKNVFEASVFYEKSLGTVGQQGLKMDQIGLRTAYLFKVR